MHHLLLLLHITTVVIKLPVSVTIPTHRTKRYGTASDRQQTPTGCHKKGFFRLVQHAVEYFDQTSSLLQGCVQALGNTLWHFVL